jgi:hypothetical protein
VEATLCALEIHGIEPQAREQVAESYRCHERAVSLRYVISQVETNTMSLRYDVIESWIVFSTGLGDYGLDLRGSRRRNDLHGSRATES